MRRSRRQLKDFLIFLVAEEEEEKRQLREFHIYEFEPATRRVILPNQQTLHEYRCVLRVPPPSTRWFHIDRVWTEKGRWLRTRWSPLRGITECRAGRVFVDRIDDALQNNQKATLLQTKTNIRIMRKMTWFWWLVEGKECDDLETIRIILVWEKHNFFGCFSFIKILFGCHLIVNSLFSLFSFSFFICRSFSSSRKNNFLFLWLNQSVESQSRLTIFSRFSYKYVYEKSRRGRGLILSCLSPPRRLPLSRSF